MAGPKVITVTSPADPVQVLTVQLPGAPGPAGPQGPAGSVNVLTIGTVTTRTPGTSATATISGVAPNQVLNLGIPAGVQGAIGPSNTLTIGTVNTLTEGQAATATLTGVSPNQVLNLGIPRGYGVRPGGLTGDILIKLSATDHDTGWHTPSSDAVAGAVVKRHADNYFSVGTIYLQNPAANPTEATRKDYVDAQRDAAKTYADGLDATQKTYVDNGLSGKANTVHTHVATDISDSTATGRSVLKAADAPTARAAIGAGTSSLAIGTTSTTAKAGDYQPASTNISDATATGRSLITAADAPTARTAIGAGTSSLVIGTTSTTAAAGDHLHSIYGRDMGTGTSLPASGNRRGDVYYHTGLTSLMVYTGSAWRQVGISTVADATARAAISTNYSTLLHSGFEVIETDTTRTWSWSGTVWQWVGGGVDPAAWTLPTLNSPWTNYLYPDYQQARYRKTGSGMVYIEGLIKGTGTAVASGTVVFTLPLGYRPPNRLLFSSISNTTVSSRLDVTSTGDVVLMSGDQGFYSINCSFSTV